MARWMLILSVGLVACDEDLALEDTAQDSGWLDAANPDADRDGYRDSVDCDDENDQVHPAALEMCNGIDDDCDGVIDEDPLTGQSSDFCG